MILKLNQILHLYIPQKGSKTIVERAPLTQEDKVRNDRVVTVVLFAGVLVSSILYNIL